MTVAKLRTLTAPGRYNAGDTLYVVVGPSGRARSWVQRLTHAGQRVDIGLGSLSVVTLAKARAKAHDNRVLASDGIDPRADKRRAKVPTFGEAAARAFGVNRAKWRSTKTATTWKRQLELYAFPVLGSTRVDQIDRPAVLKVLEPVMLAKPDTGRRLRQIVRAVFAWAMAAGHLRENPAGESIEAALPVARRQRKHLRALPYDKVGGALATVEAASAAPAVRWCLWFLVLTACRSGEARGMTWSEVDVDAAVWTVPGERMKSGKAHRVPLSRAAVAILEQARTLKDGSDLVFPSPAKPGAPLSDVSLIQALKRCRIDAVPHGFRSSFRDWCSEVASAPYEVAELSLAHTVGNATERSYARSDLYEKRRELMTEWAAFVLTT